MIRVGQKLVSNIYIGESKVSKAYLGPTLLYSESPLIASYKCYSKTNEEPDRAILKDLTGNGYDIQLKNFAFGGMSGYGGYPINYKVFTNHTNRYEGSISSCSINVTRLNPPTPAMYIVPTEYVNASIDMPEYKIRVTGVNDSTHFVIDVVAGEPLNEILLLDIRSDGEYTVPAYKNSTDIKGGNIWYRYKIVDERLITSSIDVNIKVELIPKYPGALVSNGINNYGICNNIPIFPRQAGYTIIAIRKWLDKLKESVLLCKGGNGAQEFWMEYLTYKIFDESTMSYNTSFLVKYPQLITWQRSDNYNGKNLNIGPFQPQSNSPLYLFDIYGLSTYCSKIALYALNIYNRDLTDLEIEIEKKKMMDEYEKLVP